MKVVIPAMSIDKERISVKPRKVSCTAHSISNQCIQDGWQEFPSPRLLVKRTKSLGHPSTVYFSYGKVIQEGLLTSPSPYLLLSTKSLGDPHEKLPL